MLTRLKLNTQGVNELLRSPEVKQDLQRRAERVAAAAGADLAEPEGMLVVDASDSKRSRFVVVTTTAEAMQAEAQNRVLTQAIDQAR